MRQYAVVAIAVVVGFVACKTVDRKSVDGTCNSDHDCSYGLVCHGAPPGEPGPRRCLHEEYGRCQGDADCFAGRLCRHGYCEVQCVKDVDCRDGGVRPDAGWDEAAEGPKCVVGECRWKNKPDKPCESETDCSPEEDCLAARCVPHVEPHSH